MSAARKHIVNIVRDPGCGYAKNRVLIRGLGGAGFTVDAVRANDSARQKYQGPHVPGPWAYAFARAGVIDNYGGTGASIKRDKAAGLLIEADIGDVLAIDGHEYTIAPDHNRNIKLIAVTANSRSQS